MSTKLPFQPDYAFSPGETLLETLGSLGLTQKELANRMGRPLKTINQIIKGVAQIMPETSLQLEKVTGVPASFWNNAESNYRERLARLQDEKRQEEEVGWVDRFSYKHMTEISLVAFLKVKVDRVGQLLRYFGVASPKEWESTYGGLCGAARESGQFKTDLGDLSAWLRAGELLAQKIDCENYNRENFTSNLTKIRALTSKTPSGSWHEVSRLCAISGVAVVLVPELPKTHVCGFTRWITPHKALIQLSLRYKTDDNLWFTFFHEAAHILLHGKRDVFVEYRGLDNPKEQEANQWAADFLIPPADWKSFLANIPSNPDQVIIRAFAQKQGVASSIVLGRLQHVEKLVSPRNFNTLKHKVKIAWKGLS